MLFSSPIFDRVQNIHYWRKVKRTLPLNLIGYWPLWEKAGAAAVNYGLGGSARNGAITGGTLGNLGIGDGRTSWAADGSGDVVNIYTTSFRDAFNGAEGTLLSWAKVSAAGDWTDNVLRRVVNLQVDANNLILIQKDGLPNQSVRFYYCAGGTVDQIASTQTTTGWMCLAMTWSKSAEIVRAYVNGSQVNTSSTLGVWAGSLAATTTVIGALDTTPSGGIWNGSLAHFAVWNTPLTAAQNFYLSRV